jgi:hypothetical protein
VSTFIDDLPEASDRTALDAGRGGASRSQWSHPQVFRLNVCRSEFGGRTSGYDGDTYSS